MSRVRASWPGAPAGADRTARRWAMAAVPVVMALAAWLSVAAGRRGLFAFDQSLLFDAGHRMLAGQTPFADFVLPFGPVAPALQAGLFALFGVDWSGYLASAALANAVVTGLGMLLLARLLPEHPALWLLGGSLTGVWFYPPSGTPWFDQTAFLFALGGAVLLLPAVLALVPRRSELAAAAGAGVCAVLAALSKQNAGLAVLPLFALLLAAPLVPGWRSGRAAAPLEPERESRKIVTTLSFAGGAVTAIVLFGAWLAAAATPDLFLRHVVEIPAAEGVRRLLGRSPAYAAFPLAGIDPPAIRLALTALLLVAVAAGLIAGVRRSDRHGLTGAATLAGLVLGQHLFTVTSYNQPEISAPFTGLLPPLAAGLLLRAVGQGDGEQRRGTRRPLPLRSLLRGAILAGLVGTSIVLATIGWSVSFDRTAQDVFPPGTAFGEQVAVRGLESMLWGLPTALHNPPFNTGGVVAPRDVEHLVAALEARAGPFFIFPDWTLLYGLLDRPAPQPLLWFHAGLTYPLGGDPELDRWIVGSLERNRVGTVVLERSSWLGTEARLDDFPRLAAYLARCFERDERIGIFELRSRRVSPGPCRVPAPDAAPVAPGAAG